MATSEAYCVIMKVIADSDYIYNVIDYIYIASGNGDYDYWRSCNSLQSITPTLVPLNVITVSCSVNS